MKRLLFIGIAVLIAGCASGNVRHCDSVDCMSPWRNMPVLPEPTTVETAPVVTVVAPVDSSGKPAEYTQVCDPGCRIVKAPFVELTYPQPLPPRIFWRQDPAYNVPIIIGVPVWNTMNGPRLHKK